MPLDLTFTSEYNYSCRLKNCMFSEVIFLNLLTVDICLK